jgi:hypothetical protein
MLSHTATLQRVYCNSAFIRTTYAIKIIALSTLFVQLSVQLAFFGFTWPTKVPTTAAYTHLPGHFCPITFGAISVRARSNSAVPNKCTPTIEVYEKLSRNIVLCIQPICCEQAQFYHTSIMCPCGAELNRIMRNSFWANHTE